MENNNISLTFDDLNTNKPSLNNNITFDQTITKKQFIELDNLNNISTKNTSFSEQVIDESPLETKIEQMSYDYTKPHREFLRVKQI